VSPFDLISQPVPPPEALGDPALAAALLAIEPRLGGILVRSWSGPARDDFLLRLSALFAPAPVRRVPLNISQDRLTGGIDLPATLAAGRPIRQPGLLEESQNGVLVLAMAERITTFTAAQLAGAADEGNVVLIALDEGDADEAAPASLSDRLAFTIGNFPTGPGGEATHAPTAAPAHINAARLRLNQIEGADLAADQLCQLAAVMGVPGMRAIIFAQRAARAACALRAGTEIGEEDIALAARLVLAPRATRLPAPPEDAAPEPEQAQDETTQEQEQDNQGDTNAPPPDSVQDAETPALPADILAALAAYAGPKRARGAGGAGSTPSLSRGRPIGARRGALSGQARLALLDTLRAAAPWQRLRARPAGRIAVRAEDFRIRQFKEKTRRVAVFAVDASGSSAVNRLAEAKGAILLLLAQCYVERDEVALIAFRGLAAELLLPPTGALARVRRALAGLPGGGPTPLGAGINAAAALATAQAKRGRLPYIILLTDGGANIALDQKPGRAKAGQDALAAARACTASRIPALVVDTAPRPNAFVATLAGAMGGRYFSLPYANAAALSAAAQDFGDRFARS
jgi:magnesium chelatase subunit D